MTATAARPSAEADTRRQWMRNVAHGRMTVRARAATRIRVAAGRDSAPPHISSSAARPMTLAAAKNSVDPVCQKSSAEPSAAGRLRGGRARLSLAGGAGNDRGLRPGMHSSLRST